MNFVTVVKESEKEENILTSQKVAAVLEINVSIIIHVAAVCTSTCSLLDQNFGRLEWRVKYMIYYILSNLLRPGLVNIIYYGKLHFNDPSLEPYLGKFFTVLGIIYINKSSINVAEPHKTTPFFFFFFSLDLEEQVFFYSSSWFSPASACTSQQQH